MPTLHQSNRIYLDTAEKKATVVTAKKRSDNEAIIHHSTSYREETRAKNDFVATGRFSVLFETLSSASQCDIDPLLMEHNNVDKNQPKGIENVKCFRVDKWFAMCQSE